MSYDLTRLCVGVWLALATTSCSECQKPPDPAAAQAPSHTPMTLEQLRDPETCKGCHPIHYQEWSSSMHAYASRDPVFIAMNRRGQRETDGKLGDFCVKCHAPMAVADGLTSDGLNLSELPTRDRGVSCYYCHNVLSVDGDSNAKLRLAGDNIMRGPIRDPFTAPAHGAQYSGLFDDRDPSNVTLCGACHDVVTPNGVHLERTFAEYKRGLFSKSADGKAPFFSSCQECHMPSRQGLAAVAPEGTYTRVVHEHLWPGVDLPLVDFPNQDAMRSAVEACQLGAPSINHFTLEVTPPDLFTFQIETSAGHNQPSGSVQDRRMWLEVLAYDKNGALLERVSSGNIADDEPEERAPDDPKYDRQLLMFGDIMYDAKGKRAHMFWDAAKSSAHPKGYESRALPVGTTTYVAGRHAVVQQYRLPGPDGLPARVTARIRIRPISLEVLQDLVRSGDLDPAVATKMQTLTFGAQIDWTPADGVMKTISSRVTTNCVTYRCLLHGEPKDCAAAAQL